MMLTASSFCFHLDDLLSDVAVMVVAVVVVAFGGLFYRICELCKPLE